MSPAKVTGVLSQTHPDTLTVFKDSYLVEFLDLPQGHLEADLHQGLLHHLKNFLVEFDRDFCFVGTENPLQVGGISRWTCCFSTVGSTAWWRLN